MYRYEDELAVMYRDFPEAMAGVARRLPGGDVVSVLRPDEPCGHPGCLSHVTDPCEGCGRIAGHLPPQTDSDDHGLFVVDALWLRGMRSGSEEAADQLAQMGIEPFQDGEGA